MSPEPLSPRLPPPLTYRVKEAEEGSEGRGKTTGKQCPPMGGGEFVAGVNALEGRPSSLTFGRTQGPAELGRLMASVRR